MKTTETQQTWNAKNEKRKGIKTPKHVIIKLLKTSYDKEIILKADREKRNMRYGGTKVEITANVLSETMQGWRE